MVRIVLLGWALALLSVVAVTAQPGSGEVANALLGALLLLLSLTTLFMLARRREAR